MYEYFGLIVLFYSNEHEPIHVHGKYQGFESKAERIFENGKFVEVRISNVKGKSPLKVKHQKHLKTLVEKYRDDIVNGLIFLFTINPLDLKKLPKKFSHGYINRKRRIYRRL